jgi:hypothetical protein
MLVIRDSLHAYPFRALGKTAADQTLERSINDPATCDPATATIRRGPVPHDQNGESSPASVTGVCEVEDPNRRNDRTDLDPTRRSPYRPADC